MNPFFERSPYPFEAFSFPDLTPSHMRDALDRALEKAYGNLGKVLLEKAPPSFENTVLALEVVMDDFKDVASIVSILYGAERDEELHSLSLLIAEKQSEWNRAVYQSDTLFKRVEVINGNRISLGSEDRRLTERTYAEFVRRGCRLPLEKRSRLREIDAELLNLGIQFSDNLLKATNAYFLAVEHESELKGLPEDVVLHARDQAVEKGLNDQWIFNLRSSSLSLVLDYAESAKLRETLWRADRAVAYGGNYDNESVIRKIVGLRHERALLLGYSHHADAVLEERMAKNSHEVSVFLEKLLSKALPLARDEIRALSEFKEKQTGDRELWPWDYRYWLTKMKRERIAFDQEELRPYFEMDRVLNGMFEVAHRLYGLEFKLRKDVPVYHSDVKVYEVNDSSTQEFIGLLYIDFYERDTKQGGAWAGTFFDQGLQHGKMERPHSNITANFARPDGGRASLLTIPDVKTAFHEFGHGLHSLLSNVKYTSHSGTAVYLDFVELPSQLMENWAFEPEVLDLYAFHFQTGERIPEALKSSIRANLDFHEAFRIVRQVNYALLDLAWYSSAPESVGDLSEWENKVLGNSDPLPQVLGGTISCNFPHLFSGGYSAGYYSYKWAEALSDEVFSHFKRTHLFNRELAGNFRKVILERGGSEHPARLYEKFQATLRG